MRNYHNILISLKIVIILSLCFINCNVPVENNFKEITGEALPTNAVIIESEDSPTDVHGHYGSILIVKVISDFYDSLPGKLIQKGFKPDIADPMINEFKKVKNHINLQNIVSRYKYNNKNVYYFVGFYSDKETIVLIRSSW